jgi:hypothetical protein
MYIERVLQKQERSLRCLPSHIGFLVRVLPRFFALEGRDKLQRL